MALKKTTLVWVGSQDLGADADCMTVDALFSSVGTMLEERLHDALKGCGLVGTQYRLLASIPASSSLYGTLKGLLDDGYEALARQAWESPEARWDDTRPFVEYVDDPPWPGNAMLYSQAFPNGIPGTTEPPAGFDPARLVVFTDRSFDV